MNKKSLFAALFGALCFTACTVEDNPSGYDPVYVPVDVTELVAVNAWGQSGMVPEWAAPKVQTADGRSTEMAEVYHGSNDGIAETGVLMQQTLKVENGTYAVELYANSYFTPDRGFDSDMKDGATDVAYVFANDVKAPIVAKIGTSFSEPGLYAIKKVVVTDGKLTLGFGKDKAGTNWHTIQIKSLTLLTGSNIKPEPQPDPDIDLTTLVSIEKDAWGGEGIAGTWAAPAITTSDGRTAQMVEIYHGSNDGIAETGVMMQQTIAIENATYIVELYANSLYTPNRGFDSDMQDGATDVAYVFANDVKVPIVAKVAETTQTNGEYSIEVKVTDGKLTMGLGKDKAGTNWHTIQIKSLAKK